MINLIFTVALMATLFSIFKVFHLFRINTFNSIVINYITCVITGIIYIKVTGGSLAPAFSSSPWLFAALAMGVFFVFAFYIIGITVEKVSMSVAGVANKTALIIPVMAGFLFIETEVKEYNIINYAGIAIGLLAIVLSSLRKDNAQGKHKDILQIILPLSVFLLGGILDLLMNVINYKYLNPQIQSTFTVVTFFSAATSGSIVLIFKNLKKINISSKDIIGGIGLGIPNFFSIYFLLRTLSDYENDGSFLFPVLNISVIIVTSMIAVTFFKEKLSKTNIAGIFLAILSIFMIFFE